MTRLYLFLKAVNPFYCVSSSADVLKGLTSRREKGLTRLHLLLKNVKNRIFELSLPLSVSKERDWPVGEVVLVLDIPKNPDLKLCL